MRSIDDITKDLAIALNELEDGENKLKQLEVAYEKQVQIVYKSGSKVSTLREELNKAKHAQPVGKFSFPRVKINNQWNYLTYTVGGVVLKSGMKVNVTTDKSDSYFSVTLKTRNGTVGVYNDSDIVNALYFEIESNGFKSEVYLTEEMGVQII